MKDTHLQTLHRKSNQAWELAGLARQDGDTADELRWTEKAKELDEEIKSYIT